MLLYPIIVKPSHARYTTHVCHLPDMSLTLVLITGCRTAESSRVFCSAPWRCAEQQVKFCQARRRCSLNKRNFFKCTKRAHNYNASLYSTISAGGKDAPRS